VIAAHPKVSSAPSSAVFGSTVGLPSISMAHPGGSATPACSNIETSPLAMAEDAYQHSGTIVHQRPGRSGSTVRCCFIGLSRRRAVPSAVYSGSGEETQTCTHLVPEQRWKAIGARESKCHGIGPIYHIIFCTTFGAVVHDKALGIEHRYTNQALLG
jgi:hypothetical protein